MKYLKIFEDFNLPEIKNVNELINKLKEYKIPVDYWGTGSAKTVEHLLDELNNNECIVTVENDTLVRYIEFVGIRMFYKDKDNNVYTLKEDRQEFKDGRVRRRDMQSSVSEKMVFGEDPVESAVRGIEEELNVKVRSSQLKKWRDLNYDGGSQSYPGLKTKYKGHQFTCYIDDTQYKSEGYIEVQKDKSTFFVWHKIEQ